MSAASPRSGARRPVAWAIGQATSSDAPTLRVLLRATGLAEEGFGDVLAAGDVVVARSGGRIVGCAALERFGPAALLRSVAVDGAVRGRGVGRAVVAAALDAARAGGAREAYLLTETAEGFFARLGWARADRASVPPPVAASVQFTTACPSSATAMRRSL